MAKEQKQNVKKKMCDNEIFMMAGGFQPAYIFELANAFAEIGFRVKLICGNIHANKSYHENVKLLNLRGDDSPERRFLTKVKDMIRYYAKVIWEVYRSSNKFLYKASIGRPFLEELCVNSIYRLLGKKIIHTVHNILPHDRANIKNHITYFIVYNLISNYLIVHTEYLRKRLTDEFKVPEHKIIVAHHGTYHVNEDKHITKESAKEVLDIDCSKFVIMSFGYQRYYKGTHLLLEALQGIYSRDICVIIRGVCDPNYARYLNEIIENGNLSKNVDALFGYVPDYDMEVLFKASDVIALPYLEVSQSGVLFMAYAFGRPVLASDVGGFRDYILPGKTGELFETNDCGSLRSGIQNIMRNLEEYDEDFIKRNAFENYSWNKCVSQIANNIYHNNELSPSIHR